MKIEEAIEIVKKLIDEKGIKIFFEETKEALQTLLTFAEQHNKPSREEIAETIKIKDLWWRTMHDEEPNVELGKEYCLHIADALLDKFWGEK